MPSTNDHSSQKPRNPLQEIPLSTFVRSTSSSLASSSGTSSVGTTPSSVSSLLSSGSRSSTGSRTGSGRIVHLPLSSPNRDGTTTSSSRTVRPTVQPSSPSARRWPVSNPRHARGSSLSFSHTLTPGRHQSAMLTSSPLNPRSITSGTSSVEERRSARQLLMDEVDDPGSVGMMDVDDEEEGTTVRRMGVDGRRERDREIMPPPAVPRSAFSNPTLSPARSPARRLFAAPSSDTTPRRSTTSTAPASAGPLQPSPPLPPNKTATDDGEKTEETTEKGKSKPRARTSTGRESPCPPPVKTLAVAGESESRHVADEEVAKKVKLDGTMSSVAKGKQKMSDEESLPAATSKAESQSPEEEEQLARQRSENVDPHNCGFTVWEDMNRAGPSSLGSSSSSTPMGSAPSSTSNVTQDSPSSSTPMGEKNKKALAWLTVPFDNQENIKPPVTTNQMVPFILDTNGKGKSGPSKSGKSMPNGTESAKPAATGKAASFGGASTSTTSITTSVRASAMPARSSPVAIASNRNETSIRSTMRGSIAPINITGLGAGLRGPECISPVKASASASSGQTTQLGEGGSTPILKLRRTASSLAPSRSNSVTRNGSSDIPVRPVLVLRRTGSAGNVTTLGTNSTGSRSSNESAREQENEGFTVSVVEDGTKEKSSGEEKISAEKRKAKPGRKKRKSDEMLESSSDGSLDKSGKKRPPTRSTASNINASSPRVLTREHGRRTRRSLGSSTEKKTAGTGTGKKGSENGYKGRVLRSMTRAGNGL